MRTTNPLIGIVVFLAVFVFWAAGQTAPMQPQLVPGMPMLAGDQILLSWITVPDAESYFVYLDGKKIAVVQVPPYFAPLPDKSGTYTFQVSGVNAFGEEGKMSAPGTVKVKRVAAPDNIFIQVGSDYQSVDLAWNSVPEAFKYSIYRGEEGGPLEHLAVVSDPRYRDTGVQSGIWYFYAVTATDSSGVEGPRSEELNVEIDPVKASKILSTASFMPVKRTALAVEEAFEITSLNGAELDNVSYLGAGPDGNVWVVLPDARVIHRLGATGKVISTIGPTVFESQEYNFIPHKLDIGPEGRVYVSDVQHGAVACLTGRGDVVWRKFIKPPPHLNTKVWNGFPDYFPKLGSTPSSVLCLPGELWVSDQRFQLVYRMNYEGDIVDYLTHYVKGSNAWRFRRVGELGHTSDGKFLITFPLVRKVVALDDKSQVVFEIDGSGASENYRFLAIHGMDITDHSTVLVTDPASGNLVIFSTVDGEYVHHLSLEDDYKSLTLSSPSLSVIDSKGRSWIYIAGEKRIAVLEAADGKARIGHLESGLETGVQ